VIGIRDCEAAQVAWFRSKALASGRAWSDEGHDWFALPDERHVHLMFPESLDAAAVARGVEEAKRLRATVGVWLRPETDPAVLADAKTNVRCNLPDPIMDTPVMRTLGLVLAGDDGRHVFRYGSFGSGNSLGTVGHGGAYFQYAWADPATGVSFCYLNNYVGDQQAHAVLTMPVTMAASQAS